MQICGIGEVAEDRDVDGVCGWEVFEVDGLEEWHFGGFKRLFEGVNSVDEG